MAERNLRNLPSTLPRPRPLPAAPEMIHYPFSHESAASAELPTRHFHWGIQTFRSIEDGGGLTDSTMVEVEAEDESEAISKAMALLTRANYRVAWVRETCSLDPTLKGS